MGKFNWSRIMLILLGVALEVIPKVIVSEVNSSTLPIEVDVLRDEDVSITTVKVLPPKEVTPVLTNIDL